MTQSAYSSPTQNLTENVDQIPLLPAPIPYLNANDDETPLPPAPIPYLRLASSTRSGLSSGVGDTGGDVNEVDDEGGDNEGDVTDVDEGQERIVGIDERIQINPATSQPYRWI